MLTFNVFTGCRAHLFSRHKGPLLEKFMAQEKELEKLRTQAAEKIFAAKKKKENLGQPKLSFKDGRLSVNFQKDPEMQARWDLAVVLYLSETFSSFRAVAKMGILLNAIWPSGKHKIQVRSPVTIAKHVEERAEKLLQEMYAIIGSLVGDGEGGGVACTSDIWTSRLLASFMSLTVHIITEEMELLKFCPFVNYMDGLSHTGENILIKLTNFLQKLGLDSVNVRRVICMDNAANNKKATRIADDTFEGMWCLNHTINLCITDMFQKTVCKDSAHTEIKTVLTKCQSVAVLVHRSEGNLGDLKEACTRTVTPFHKPVLGVKTRWNSIDDNVDSNLKLELPLRLLSDQDSTPKKIWRTRVLSPAEYRAASGMHKALKSFKLATKKFECDTAPTLHLVVPELFNIEDNLRKLTREPGVVSEFAAILLTSFERRFPECYARSKLYAIAHIIDPANKGCVLDVFDGAYEAGRQQLLLLLQKYDKNTPLLSAETDVCESPAANEDEDENLSAVERLKKRRKLSGDGAESLPRPSVRSIPAAELELQTYEKLEVIMDKRNLEWN